MRSSMLLIPLVLSVGVATGGAIAQAPPSTSSRDQAPPATRTDRPPTDATSPPGAATPVEDVARTLLGITVVTTGTERDTLGLLVSGVVPASPADRAGLEVGSRLTEVNGVSLRVALDVEGDEGAAQRRLTRVLRAVSPGDDVSLRLYRGGRFRDVTVQAAGTSAKATSSAAAPAGAVVPPVVGTITASATTPSPTAPVTLAKVSEATAQAQTLLRRLVAQEEEAEGPLLDTLIQLQAQLADVQRRLRAAQAPAPKARVPATAAAVDDDAPTSAGDAIAGLRVEVVAEDLAPFYGEGSAGGLIVLHAEAAWAPLRAGDVITSISDQPPTLARLRAVAQGTRAGRLEVLRKRRLIAITVQPE